MLEHIPNIITTLRIIAIVPICWLLWQDAFVPAFFCLMAAGLSDGLDGYLARRFGWITQLGALLDPVADKLFIVSIMIVFGLKGYLPVWLVWLVLGRDILIVSGTVFYRWLTGSLEVKPLMISKLNTALQILLLMVTLLHIGFHALPLAVTQALQAMVAMMTILSGLAYVYQGIYYAFNKEMSV